MRFLRKTALITLAIGIVVVPYAPRGLASLAWTEDPPRVGDRLTLLPERVFAPSGFDNQDHAQLTLKAALPDTCFEIGRASSEVDTVSKRIQVEVEAVRISVENCAYVETPWVRTLELGTLAAGNYEIFAKNDQGGWVKSGELPVGPRRQPMPPNTGTAIVDRAWMESGAMILQGRLPSPCTRLEQIQTVYQAKNVIEVMPVTWTNPAMVCDQYLVPFEIRVPLRERWKGDTLLHVRSQGGEALNEVVNL